MRALKNNSGDGLCRDRLFWPAMLLGGAVLSLTLWFGFGMDQSICAYAAWLWKHYQKPPYVGSWDLSFPGIFIVYRLALALFGDSMLAVRIFDCLVQLSTLVMIFHLAKKISGQSLAGALAAVFFSIFYFGHGELETAQRESCIFWCLLAAVVIFFRSEKRSRLRDICTGLLLGFAFLVKPFFGLAWPVFGALIFFERLRQSPKRAVPALLLFSLACVLPSLLVIFYYWRINGLEDLYRQTLWFNFKIYGSSGLNPLGGSRLSLLIIRHVIRQQPLILWPGLLGVVLCLRTAARHERKMLWAIISLIIVSLISYRLQNKYFAFHLFPFWGFLLVFAAAAMARALSALAGKLQNPARAVFYPLAVLLLLVLMALLSVPQSQMQYARKYAFRNLDQAYASGLGTPEDHHLAADQFLAAQYLKPKLKPGDQLVFFGPYPLVQFLLHIRQLSRFICLQHFLFRAPDNNLTTRQFAWMQEFSSEVLRARPRFFLVANSFPGMKSRFMNLASRSLHQELNQEFPELAEMLRKHYTRTHQCGEIEIFEIIPSPQRQ